MWRSVLGFALVAIGVHFVAFVEASPPSQCCKTATVVSVHGGVPLIRKAVE